MRRFQALMLALPMMALSLSPCFAEEVTLQTGSAPAPPADSAIAAEVQQSSGGAVNKKADTLSPQPTTNADSPKQIFGSRPRLLLALGGGGCKSVAQIGVLRSLEKNHIPIDGIIGTSMGATIGAMYCAGISIDDIEKVFVNQTVQKSFPPIILSAAMRPAALLRNAFTKNKLYGGLSSGTKLHKFLAKQLPPTFADLKIPFAAVATNLTDGRSCVLAEGDLPKSVLASNSVPPLFRPVEIDGKLFLDGGLKANLPAELAQKIGADVVVSVLVDTSIKPQPNKDFVSLNHVVSRVKDIVLGAADKQSAKATDILIFPDLNDVPMLTKDSALIKEGIANGEKACDLVIPKIKGELVVAKLVDENKPTDTKKEIAVSSKTVENAKTAAVESTTK